MEKAFVNFVHRKNAVDSVLSKQKTMAALQLTAAWRPASKFLIIFASCSLCIVILTRSFRLSIFVNNPLEQSKQLSTDNRRRVPPSVYQPNCGSDKVLCGVNETLLLGNANTRTLNQLKQEFFRLVTNDNKQICPTQKPFGGNGFGYEICLTEQFKPQPYNCLAYSFGVGGDWTFDAALAQYGCEVHSFDPSLGRKDGMLAPNVSFHAVGLWGSDIVNSRGWQLNKLSTVRNKLGHTHRILDVLKVDVEIGEWPFLRNVVDEEPWQLTSVRQLIFELHAPGYQPSQQITPNNMLEIIHYFQRLEQLGFVLYLERRISSPDPGCCGHFVPFMPAGVTEKCCYESLYLNTGKVVAD